MNLLQILAAPLQPSRRVCAAGAYAVALLLLLGGLALVHGARSEGDATATAAAALIESAPTGAGPRLVEIATPAGDLAGPGHDMAAADRDLVGASIAAYDR